MTNFDDEIDIRPYIQSIISKWWLIGLLVVISVSLAVFLSFQNPKMYKSTTTLLLNRSRSFLALASQFPTVDSADPEVRLSEILTIAKSEVVAQKVFESMKDKLEKEKIQQDDFINIVGISSEGDLVLVAAKNKNPILATEIANEWAKQAVSLINQAYSGEKPVEKIQEQLVIARQEYETSQNELVGFYETSQLDVLGKNITAAEKILDTLLSNKALRTNYYNQRRMSIEALKVEAEALKQQLQVGGQSKAAEFGDALAVLQARANALALSPNNDLIIMNQQSDQTFAGFNETETTPLSYTIQTGDLLAIQGESEAYVEDLDHMISVFTQEEERLLQAITDITEDVSGSESEASVALVASQLQKMRAQKEVEEAKLRELTNQRNLAEEAVQVLAQKETEIRNAVQTTNQVSLVNSAIPGTEPLPRGTLQKVIIAAALGLVVGLGWVVIRHWWKSIGQPNQG